MSKQWGESTSAPAAKAPPPTLANDASQQAARTRQNQMAELEAQMRALKEEMGVLQAVGHSSVAGEQ